MVHKLPLLGSDHQLRHRVGADRHICEEPSKLCPPLHHLVKIGLAADNIHIGASIAARDAEGQLFALEYLHGAHHSLESAMPSPGICRLFKAFYADSGDKILDTQHLVGKCLIDQRRVGKRHKYTVGMAFAEGNDILFPNKRFAAGIEIHVGTQLRTLADDGVHRIQVHIHLIAVFRRPAACTVKIAGRSGVHQDSPWDIAAVLLTVVTLFWEPDQRRVHNKIFKKRLTNSVVDVCPQTFNQTIPVVVRILDHLPGLLPGSSKDIFSRKLIYPVHNFRQIPIRVLVQIVVHDGHACFFNPIHQSHAESLLFECKNISKLLSLS